jgi:hypothetical protein
MVRPLKSAPGAYSGPENALLTVIGTPGLLSGLPQEKQESLRRSLVRAVPGSLLDKIRANNMAMLRSTRANANPLIANNMRIIEKLTDNGGYLTGEKLRRAFATSNGLHFFSQVLPFHKKILDWGDAARNNPPAAAVSVSGVQQNSQPNSNGGQVDTPLFTQTANPTTTSLQRQQPAAAPPAPTAVVEKEEDEEVQVIDCTDPNCTTCFTEGDEDTGRTSTSPETPVTTSDQVPPPRQEAIVNNEPTPTRVFNRSPSFVDNENNSAAAGIASSTIGFNVESSGTTDFGGNYGDYYHPTNCTGCALCTESVADTHVYTGSVRNSQQRRLQTPLSRERDIITEYPRADEEFPEEVGEDSSGYEIYQPPPSKRGRFTAGRGNRGRGVGSRGGGGGGGGRGGRNNLVSRFGGGSGSLPHYFGLPPTAEPVLRSGGVSDSSIDNPQERRNLRTYQAQQQRQYRGNQTDRPYQSTTLSEFGEEIEEEENPDLRRGVFTEHEVSEHRPVRQRRSRTPAVVATPRRTAILRGGIRVDLGPDTATGPRLRNPQNILLPSGSDPAFAGGLGGNLFGSGSHNHRESNRLY